VALQIIAVGHDAYRAGAQILFLHLLRWLRDHHRAELFLLLGADGALVEDYAATLPTRVLPPPPSRAGGSRPSRQLARARHELDLRRVRHRLGPADLVYANSVASARLALRLAAGWRCPVLCHVHELDMAIRRSPGAGPFREAAARIERFVAVSRAVEQTLVEGYDVDPRRIDRIPGGIPLPPAGGRAERRRAVTAELGLAPDAFVVGGSGTLDWRKGPELFLLVARSLARRAGARPLAFVWVGGEPGPRAQLARDVARTGLDGVVHLVGQTAEPSRYFAAFDAFLLTSREDPFPLVCLEAAALGVPVVCFEDAGGAPELVEADAGFVVPYLDVEAAAGRLGELAASEATRSALGRRAAEKVAERCSIDVVGPRVAAVIDRLL